jgi:hypothetical protein
MKALLFVIAMFSWASLSAQDTIINKGKFGLSGMMMNVNGQNQSILNSDFSHNLKRKKFDLTFSNNYVLSYKDGRKIQDDNIIRLQPRIVTKSWSLFAFGQVSRAFSRKLDNRTEAGIGGGHNLFKGKWYTVTGSYGILYDASDYSNGSEIKAFRHSPRLQFFGNLGRTSFFTEAFYQPMTRDFNNYNYRTHVEIKYEINQKLSISTSYKRWYETFNVTGTSGLIENLTVGTTFSY